MKLYYNCNYISISIYNIYRQYDRLYAGRCLCRPRGTYILSYLLTYITLHYILTTYIHTYLHTLTYLHTYILTYIHTLHTLHYIHTYITLLLHIYITLQLDVHYNTWVGLDIRSLHIQLGIIYTLLTYIHTYIILHNTTLHYITLHYITILKIGPMQAIASADRGVLEGLLVLLRQLPPLLYILYIYIYIYICVHITYVYIYI